MRRSGLALISLGLAAFLFWRLRMLWRDEQEASASRYRLENSEMPPAANIPASLLQPQPSVIERPTQPDSDQQHYTDGTGPLFHRRYSISFAHPKHTREGLMDYIRHQLPEFAPSLLAKFEKRGDDESQMQIDDEYNIKILGPWNGVIRVADIKPTSFALVTLEGHPEAGEICFSIEPYQDADDQSCFSIESLARSRDSLVSLLYREAGIGLEVQRQTWVTFCERVADFGGNALGEVDVLTEELSND